jgi:hypothetical protein
MKTKKFTQQKWGILVCITLISGAVQAQNIPTDSNSEYKKDSLKKTENIKQINLNEITVSASFLPEKTSPLRIKTINSSEISSKATGQTYPEIMKSIPGIYATAESGSYGDARINIRGFKQENISVLLNGIPISGLTTGGMYWNNWIGLTDATSALQVQKGPGASMLSDNSMGGTINIITSTPVEKSFTSVGVSITDYGLRKYQATYNTGILKNGWAASVSASYATGKTFVESSNVNSWAYLLNISKKINERSSLLLTLLGSPERHQQRSARLTLAEVEKYGAGYSKNWGYYNNKARNISENFYHKPYLTLQHFWELSENTSMNTAVYISNGNGGGLWSESKGTPIIGFQKDGHIDWDSVISSSRDASTGESIRVETNYLAGHLQSGIKWGVISNISERTKIESGFHYQHYTTWEKEKITDLLGGDYWFEDYQNYSMAGVAGRNQIKGVGDLIRLHSGKVIDHGTIYTLFTYDAAKGDAAKRRNITAKFGVSLMSSNIKRWDKYNYVADIYSKSAKGNGYSIKAGILAKLDPSNSLYLNGAVYSRIPYSDIYFSSWNNNITSGVKNESKFLTEAGYRYIGESFSTEVTAYIAYWKNKSLMSNPYMVQEIGLSRYLVSGLDALHTGVEADFEYTPFTQLKIKGYASIADWRWKNDVNAIIYDNYSGSVTGTFNIYTNGIPVGDSPQNQISVGANYNPSPAGSFYAELRYYDKYYADFEPSGRTDSSNREVFRIPGYSIFNAGASLKFKLLGKSAAINLNINNLFGTHYIERGLDGSDHTIETFKGYWSNGISANISLRVSQ